MDEPVDAPRTDLPSAHEIGRHASRTATALLLLAAVMAVLAAAVVWAEVRDPDPWSPLHYTNPQTVTSRVNLLSGAPAARIGDTVNVTGEKCSDEEVDILAVTAWKPVDPRGPSIVTEPEHAATREAGCVTSRFQNEIPDEVVEVVRRQHASGYPAPMWQIQGSETPIDADGRFGSVEVWTTEPFAIVARES